MNKQINYCEVSNFTKMFGNTNADSSNNTMLLLFITSLYLIHGPSNIWDVGLIPLNNHELFIHIQRINPILK